MVHRRRQVRGQRAPDARRVLTGQQGTSRGAHRAGARDAQRLGLGEHRGHGVQGRRGARRAPHEDVVHLLGGQCAVVREHAEHRAAQPRRPRTSGLGVERRAQRAALVARADQPCGALGAQPRLGQLRPALCGRQGCPHVRGGRGAERRRVLAVVDHQPGRGDDLDHEGCGGLVHLEAGGQPAQLARAKAAGPQHARLLAAPRGEHAAREPHEVLRRPGGLGVGRRGRHVAGGRTGRRRLVAMRASRAQGQGDLAREHHVLRVPAAEQAVRQQPADGGLGRAGRVGHPADGRAPGQGVEHLRRAARRVGEQQRDGRGPGEVRRHGLGGRGRRADLLGEGAQGGGGPARQGGPERWAEARRVRPDEVGEPGARVQAVVGPQHGVREPRGHRVVDLLAQRQRELFRGGGWQHRALERRDGLEDAQHVRVERGEHALEARAARGTGAEGPDRCRRRGGQVLAQREQRGQPVRTALAQVLGVGGHPHHDTGP